MLLDSCWTYYLLLNSILSLCYEKFEDTKGVIRSGESEDRYYNGQKKTDNNETHNTIKQRIEH